MNRSTLLSVPALAPQPAGASADLSSAAAAGATIDTESALAVVLEPSECGYQTLRATSSGASAGSVLSLHCDSCTVSSPTR